MSTNAIGFIYAAVHIDNGKIYIGKTQKSVEFRIASHVRESRRQKQSLFHRAIAKHGISAFEIHTLDKASSAEELNDLEKLYIAIHRSMAPRGYNLTVGGTGGRQADEIIITTAQKLRGRRQNLDTVKRRALSNTGKKRSPETREKISRAHRGKHPNLYLFRPATVSLEARLKMSLAKKGKPRPERKGIPIIPVGSKRPPFSDEWKANMSASRKGKVAWVKSWIVTFPDGHEETFAGLRQFCLRNGLSLQNMSAVAHGKVKTHKGFKCRIIDTVPDT